MPRRTQLRRRRRDEGEDTESVADRAEDSHSDASLPSDDDGDADDSDLSDAEAPAPGPLSVAAKAAKANGSVEKQDEDAASSAAPAVETTEKDGSFTRSEDTDAMMNGLKLAEVTPREEALDFEGSTKEAPTASETDPAGQATAEASRDESMPERRKREHDEYKKKRDEDPAFIPTRGAFFMHDQRAAQAQHGARILGRGRGRGAVVGGPFSPANLRPQPPDATRSAWTHDLHESLHESDASAGAQQRLPPTSMPGGSSRPFASVPPKQTIVRNYSTTRELGHVQIRIQLHGMKDAVTYGNTLIRQYTKLPDHRPPLRRDKPVRISLPDKSPRYIFPAVDRSFIFIPRALRPNQQGFGRGRSKLGSMGGFSSRRTSVFGGSVYSPSVAMSRRSSFARDFNRETLVSPAGSVRPVVRMPPGSQHSTAVGTPIAMSHSGTPVMNGPPMYTYSQSQKPPYRENWAANMPMHQPRPQKTVSVAGIESPASNFQPPPPAQDQPFSHQLPAGVNTMNSQPLPGMFYPPQPSYAGQPAGTPLSNIPERAIHAPAFQPYQPGYQPGAYYYAPLQPQYQPGAVVAPMLMQNGQQGTYLVPTIAAGPAGAAQPVQPPQGQGAVQHYEQNGTMYFYDPAQMYMAPAADGQAYGGYMAPMMAPAADGSGYYYPMPNQAVYYPQQ